MAACKITEKREEELRAVWWLVLLCCVLYQDYLRVAHHFGSQIFFIFLFYFFIFGWVFNVSTDGLCGPAHSAQPSGDTAEPLHHQAELLRSVLHARKS